jgi:hypothetical protein
MDFMATATATATAVQAPEPSLDEYYQGGPESFQEAFPPACIRTHWDPTQISKHVLPGALIAAQPTDPRPSTRICTSYYTTSQGDAPLPAPLSNAETENIPDALLGPRYYVRQNGVVGVRAQPPGGAAGKNAPYPVYASNIGTESDLFRLGENLTRCKDRRYQPRPAPADATNTLPDVSQEFELGKYATYVTKRAGCRDADDNDAWNRSGRLFFNQTRMDRVYPQARGPLACTTNQTFE